MDTVGRLSMDFGMSLPITPLHLGPEHCFTGPPPAPGKPPAKEKHIEHFNRCVRRATGGGGVSACVGDVPLAIAVIRLFHALNLPPLPLLVPCSDPKSILLIDFDRLSETCNPRNTVIVKCVPPQ